MSGKITLVGAGPGDPDLITLRGYRALQRADVIFYDDLIDAHVVDDLPARKVYVGKRCGKHAMPQEEINAQLVAEAQAGSQVVRVKGGDPTVLGRGGEEALAAVAAGIPFEIVPGVSSSVGVPALAGIPVTHRGLADSFCVISAHPRGADTPFSLPAFSERTTLVLLMGATSVPRWAGELRNLGYPAALPIAFVMHGASASQRVVTTTLADVEAAAVRDAVASPAVAVVGRVVGLQAQLASGMSERRHDSGLWPKLVARNERTEVESRAPARSLVSQRGSK